VTHHLAEVRQLGRRLAIRREGNFQEVSLGPEENLEELYRRVVLGDGRAPKQTFGLSGAGFSGRDQLPPGLSLEGGHHPVSPDYFLFLARLVEGSVLPQLGPYGGHYFPFVMLGLALAGFQGVALTAISNNILPLTPNYLTEE
jgi:hypothetical protein